MNSVIVLWVSCKPASKGGFRSPLDYRAWVSNTPHPSFLACPPPMQCMHSLERERLRQGDPGETRHLLGKLCPCPLTSQPSQKNPLPQPGPHSTT